MKRNIKNMIMIGIIIFMVAAAFFTVNYAKNHIVSAELNSNSQGMENNGTPPQLPSGNSSENNDTNGETPPQLPEGNAPGSNDTSGQTPPEKPEGDDNNAPNGTPGEMPREGLFGTTLTLGYYIVFGIEGFVISIFLVYLIMSKLNQKTFKDTFKNKGKAIISISLIAILTFVLTYTSGIITNNYFLKNANQQPGNENGADASVNYSAKKEITDNETITEGTFTSTAADENAISASGDISASLSGITVHKTGDSDGGDTTSFYGINSAVLVKGGAKIDFKNITVQTDAVGANGIFSYGGSATTENTTSDGTTVTVSDSKITTTKDNSGGIMATGGGILKATNLTVNTAGVSSAAIRTDRGGGTVTVNGGMYTTTGQGSPAIYSTADVTVNKANLVATASEGIVIEGKNAVTISNCNLTDTNNKLNGQSTTYKNIFLYQSMSGDADTGTSSFTAKNSKITTNKGDTFYITNTTATITLENNTFVNNDSAGNFLRAQKDSWGKSGSNGGVVTLTMKNQKAVGNIAIDSVSSLNMTMQSGSSYEGTINGDNSAKSIKLSLDASSTIQLTGNSYVTSLENSDTTNSNIDFNGYKLYVNGKAVN